MKNGIIVNESTGARFLERWRIKVVLPYLNGRVLDIGCGHNNLLANYKRIKNGDGIGVDIIQWGPVDIVADNSANLSMFEDGSFNTITFLACINHILNREEVLAEAWRLLAPDGRLVITMIPRGIGDFWHRFTSHFYGKEKHALNEKSGEVGGMNRREIHALLKKTGFALISEKRFMVGINHLYIAAKR